MELHPSLRLLRSPFPAQTIWTMNASDGDVRPVDLGQAEDTLIVRPDAEVTVRRVPPGGAAFVAALAKARRSAKRPPQAMADDARFDLAGNISGLIAAGAIAGIVTTERGATT